MWNNWTTAPFTLYTAPSQSATTSTREAYRNDLYTINVFATYDKTFAKDHNLKVMVGGTAERERYDDFYVRRSGLLDNSLPDTDVGGDDAFPCESGRYESGHAGLADFHTVL